MKILFISNLFPDHEAPVRGLDNATLLGWISRNFGVEFQVIAPRPALPWQRNGRWRSGESETDFQPVYPPVLYVPKYGSRWNDHLMSRGIHKHFQRAIADFQPDLVLSSWLFPDGCAVAELCREFKVPLILITQGTDTHQYLGDPIRRRKIVRATDQSQFVICRSGDLAERLARAGVDERKLKTVYNGVDTEIFRPSSQREARGNLSIPDHHGKHLLFVGNFLPVKDPLFLLNVHARLNRQRNSPVHFVMIGDGPLRKKMLQEAEELGTAELVSMPGRMDSAKIATWMNAADLFVLGSENEGFPNVLLEAMACGLKMISTDVGGISEKLSGLSSARLVQKGQMDDYVALAQELLSNSERGCVPEDFSWEKAASDYAAIFDEVLGKQLRSGLR